MADDILTVAGLPVPRAAIDKALNDTAEQVKALAGSTASPNLVNMLTMTLRAGAYVWGAQHAAVAQTVTGDETQTVIGIAAIVIAYGCGIVAQKWVAWRLHETAKASASASAAATVINGAATSVAVQPS